MRPFWQHALFFLIGAVATLGLINFIDWLTPEILP
jgi:hypothetical protein